MEYNEAKQKIYKLLEDFVCIPLMGENIEEGIAFIKKETFCDDQTAKLIWRDLKIDYGTKENNPIIRARESYKAEEAAKKATEDYKYRNNAECPYCHSKNTKKISTTSKVVNTAVFGLFGTKRFKQWHCNNCRSDF